MGQRLLHIDVLATPDRRHRYHRVRVIGGGHDYRVEVLLAVQHEAEVLVPFGPGVCRERLCGDLGIHVAQGDDITLFGAGGDIVGAHPADADSRNVKLFAGRRLPRAAHARAAARRKRPRRQPRYPGRFCGMTRRSFSFPE